MAAEEVCSEASLHNVKVVETPKHTEFWFYGKMHSKSETLKVSKPRRRFEDMDDFDQLVSMIRKKKSISRRLQDLRRLVECNYVRGKSKFLTLTYGDASRTDPDECKSDLKDFIARLRYRLEVREGKGERVQYIAVTEIQNKRGRKYGDYVVHWHVLLFNMDFLKKKEFQAIWGRGNVWIEAIDDAGAAADYVTKYVGKELEQNSRRYKRAWLASRGLERPAEGTWELEGSSDEQLARFLADAREREGWDGEMVYDYEYSTPLGESIRYVSIPRGPSVRPARRKRRPGRKS